MQSLGDSKRLKGYGLGSDSFLLAALDDGPAANANSWAVLL
jgi:hypothetical protein